mmetsp:Transcript_47282/g.132045  ORF Transcript_47282/g.132045 Transcript_47282/m.132045 type:complete len:302 (+) Transcript_47282:146-1051(+)
MCPPAYPPGGLHAFHRYTALVGASRPQRADPSATRNPAEFSPFRPCETGRPRPAVTPRRRRRGLATPPNGVPSRQAHCSRRRAGSPSHALELKRVRPHRQEAASEVASTPWRPWCAITETLCRRTKDNQTKQVYPTSILQNSYAASPGAAATAKSNAMAVAAAYAAQTDDTAVATNPVHAVATGETAGACPICEVAALETMAAMAADTLHVHRRAGAPTAAAAMAVVAAGMLAGESATTPAPAAAIPTSFATEAMVPACDAPAHCACAAHAACFAGTASADSKPSDTARRACPIEASNPAC